MNVALVYVAGEFYPQSVDGVVCRRCDMVKRSPVVGYHDARPQCFEQAQRIMTGQVATPEA